MAKTASRQRPVWRCAECGWESPRWAGRCGECQAWATVEGPSDPTGRPTMVGPVSAPARRIRDVDARAARAVPTGVGELDRVLGGGLVPGAVVLVAGEPGVGKSTLLLEVAARCATAEAPTLYLSGEESAAQVRLRAERVGALAPHLFVAAETDLSAVLGHIETVRPGLLVVDSVQTVASTEVDGSPGNVSQVREVAGALSRVAKDRAMATLLVGHVTKDGSIAGPRLLEHLVDVVLQVEGDRHSRLRLVRSVKNRYGPTDEVGCFELTDDGVVGLPDPSGLFLSRHDGAVPGTCLTVSVEGSRPLLAEVQALVARSSMATPRRATSGLDSARLAMVLAVLERRAGVKLSSCEVFASTVGGIRLAEPAADLAIAVAIAGAATDRPLPPGLVALGEVGLAGEVRAVTGLAHRLAEAARLGCSRALVPAARPLRGPPVRMPTGIAVVEVSDVTAALQALRAPVPAARLHAVPSAPAG